MTRILHFGDHDPSGIDMTRDIADRLHLFGSEVDVRRVALNMDQIDQYDPPPNPAKLSDSRSEKYVSEFGPNSWELDALEPRVLAALVDLEIDEVLEEDLWAEDVATEARNKSELSLVSNSWGLVVDAANGLI